MNREEELAKGLERLQRDMSSMMRHMEEIQNIVPVFNFGPLIDSAEEAEDRAIEGQTATLPMLHEFDSSKETHTPAPTGYQIPMFEYPQPVTIIFENVTINGESVDLQKEQIDGSDS